MTPWMIATQWGARAVLLLLFALSFWSVAIMIERRWYLKNLRRSDSFSQAKDLVLRKERAELQAWIVAHPSGLRSRTLQASLSAARSATAIDRNVRSLLVTERGNLERGLTTLATLGSNAPFIGLFGTVLGIIQAFGALSVSQESAGGVMSGISEALVATAVGLFVAIPAVVAFNALSNDLRNLLSECESLRDLFVAHWIEKSDGG